MITSDEFLTAMQSALLLFAICSVMTILLSYLSCRIASTGGGLIADYLTFPGVIHHELSHALVAFLCGAKVTRVVLFKVDHRDGQLGYVSYVPQGPRLLKGLQSTLSGAAPVFCGVVTVSLLYLFIMPMAHGWGRYIVWYLMICIAFHMNLSGADWHNASNGLLAAMAVFLIASCAFFLVSGIDLMTTVQRTWASLIGSHPLS